MRVLVTGAVGSVGVRVMQQLLDSGDEPLAVDIRTTYENRPSLEGAVPHFPVDILDTETLADLLRDERPDWVCHLAALVTAPSMDAEDDPYASFATNGMGTVSVLEAARRAGVRRVTIASSKAVYGPFEGRFGHPTYEPVTEEHPRRPASYSRPYGASKILSEEAGLHYMAKFGISFRACRFGTIVRAGKKDLGGSFAAPYAEAVRAALRGEPYERTVVRGAIDDVMYVGDVAQGLIRAGTVDEVASWAFNIATGRATTWEEWADAIGTVIPTADIRLQVLDGPGEGFRSQSRLNIDRARRELSYEPAFGLEAMVVDLIEELTARNLVA